MTWSPKFPQENGYYWLKWNRPTESGHHEIVETDDLSYEICRIVNGQLWFCGSGSDNREWVMKRNPHFSKRLQSFA